MSDQNSMAAQQRPSFTQRPSAPPPAFSPPFAQPSPLSHMNLTSAQQPPSMPYPQLPANKRPRLSPGVPSPYDPPSFSVMSDMRADGPPNTASVNGMMPAPAPAPAPPPPGSMGPPSRPAEKA